MPGINLLKVRVGNVVDTQTWVIYKSRTDCIAALGREVAVPLMHSRKKRRRLRIITVNDRLKALFAQGETACTMAAMELECTLRDLGSHAQGGWTPQKFDDVRSLLRTHCEAIENQLDNVGEAGAVLGQHEELETLRHEFQIDIGRDMADMVYRL